MLHRNTSSRRRRASRSAASSPQASRNRSGTSSTSPSPGRRASIAVSPVEPCSNSERLTVDMCRSPRHSLVPDISLSRNSLEDLTELGHRDESRRNSRMSLVPDNFSRSPRNSITPDSHHYIDDIDQMDHGRNGRKNLNPDNFNRSPRNSINPEGPLIPRSILLSEQSLSPRNSLIPDQILSPRNSLIPDSFNRSPRNSLVPDSNRSPRNSLVPEGNPRSPRHSLTPEVHFDYNRSPRNSLVPEYNRSPRHSLVLNDSTGLYPKTSPNDDSGMKSPRHTSPRGSIAQDLKTSPRDSIVSISEYPEIIRDRSPRASICADVPRSPRGSIARVSNESRRCSKGSLTLTFQEPPATERRYSADNQNVKSTGRSTSPYRMSLRGPQINLGYSTSAISDFGSRRASSCISQVSSDEQRRLCCEHTKLGSTSEQGLPLGVSLATYGSVAYQLKDANLEASGTCDFVCRALRIVHKTVAVTVVLVCLSTLPLLMLIMGIQFLRDCPREPHIPVYMVVGGSLGSVKMAWALYNQLTNRRLDDSSISATSAGSKVASLALTVFLIAWFTLGNYWIIHIKWPDYQPTLYEPNKWCHRTLYVFSIVHLCVIYSVLSMVSVLILALATCQLVGCPLFGPTRYK